MRSMVEGARRDMCIPGKLYRHAPQSNRSEQLFHTFLAETAPRLSAADAKRPRSYDRERSAGQRVGRAEPD
jgi:hypothetical protein